MLVIFRSVKKSKFVTFLRQHLSMQSNGFDFIIRSDDNSNHRAVWCQPLHVMTVLRDFREQIISRSKNHDCPRCVSSFEYIRWHFQVDWVQKDAAIAFTSHARDMFHARGIFWNQYYEYKILGFNFLNTELFVSLTFYKHRILTCRFI